MFGNVEYSFYYSFSAGDVYSPARLTQFIVYSKSDLVSLRLRIRCGAYSSDTEFIQDDWVEDHNQVYPYSLFLQGIQPIVEPQSYVYFGIILTMSSINGAEVCNLPNCVNVVSRTTSPSFLVASGQNNVTKTNGMPGGLAAVSLKQVLNDSLNSVYASDLGSKPHTSAAHWSGSHMFLAGQGIAAFCPEPSTSLLLVTDATAFNDGSFIAGSLYFCKGVVFEQPNRLASHYHRHIRQTVLAPTLWASSFLVHESFEERVLLSYPQGKRLDGLFCLLTSVHSSNFGHFIHDVLARIYYYRGCLEAVDYQFILNRPRWPFQQFLIDLLIPSHRQIFLDDPSVDITRLVISRLPCSYNYLDKSAIQWLSAFIRRQIVALIHSNPSVYASPLDLPKKVFVSRSSDRSNPSIREKIEDYLPFVELLAKHSFERIVISDLSCAQTASIFIYADVLVGVHGAGMMNSIIMKPDSTYIEIVPSPYPDWTYRCASSIIDKSYVVGFNSITDPGWIAAIALILQSL